MALHSSTLAWKIPWAEAFHGVAKSRTQLSDFTFTCHFHALEKEMQPTPVFLPGESHGQRSLVGCSPWGCKESDTTEQLSTHREQGNREEQVETLIVTLESPYSRCSPVHEAPF